MRICKPSYQESSTPNEFVVVLLRDGDEDQGRGLAQGRGQGLDKQGQGLDTNGQELGAGDSGPSAVESVRLEDWLSPKQP